MRYFIFLAVALGSIDAFAQSAAVNGIITDPSGARISGSLIKITDQQTNLQYEGRSNDDGYYVVPLLPSGQFSIVATAPSFQSERTTDIHLETGQNMRVNFTLSPAGTAQDVLVSATPNATDTDSAAVGTVIDSRKVVELPLNGRQFFSLSLLVPGVYPPVAGSSLSFRGGLNIAGSNENLNSYTLDGFNNNDEAISGPSFRPSIDAIQEFKVYTGNYDADLGRNASGQVVVTSKSGGNTFHGDLFEFIRNDIADARNFFAPTVEPPLKRNQFGGTLGGPIKRNQSFFFFSYEGLRLRQGIAIASTVPTQTMIQGVFNTPIHAPTGYSPDVVQFNSANQTYSINPQSLTGAQAKAYMVGKALLSFYPDPTNNNVVAGQPSQNFLFNGLTSESTDQYSLRLDHRFRTSDSLFVTLNYLHDDVLTPNNPVCGNFTVPGFTCHAQLTTQLYGAGWTHIFTSNLVNEFRVGLQRLRQPRFIAASNNFDQEFGIPAFTGAPSANINGTPTTSISGFASFGDANNLPQDRADNTFDYVDSLFWTIGKHSIKAGFEISPFQANLRLSLFGSAGLTFTGGNTGNSVADALLGMPFISFQNIGPSQTNLRSSDYALYVQDEYKILQNLTLNYGLRWESFTPISSPSNQISSFDPTTGQPVEAGVNGRPKDPYAVWNGGFAPRVGFSYQPTGHASTVVRGGFGISYASPIVENGFAFFLFSPPIHKLSVFSGPGHLLPDPFVSSGPPSLTPAGVARNFRPGEVHTWSLDVQHELARNTVLDVAYVGSSGVHLEDQRNINQPSILSPGVVGANPFSSFGDIVWAESEGSSNFHSLQVKLDRRYAHGLNIVISDTLGKSLDDVGLFTTSTSNVVASLGMPQNSHNLSSEYGRSDFDVRNRLVLSPIYDLPFGRGERYFTDGWTRHIFGGFRLAGIATLQTGAPSTPYLSTAFAGSKTGNSNLTGGDTDRPDIVPGLDPNKGPKTVSQWFNTAAFRVPQAGTFGNAGRNILKGPGFTEVDLALHRDFGLGGERTLQFRGEVFNVANHPLFSLPNATLNSVAASGIANTSSSFGPISSTQGDSREIQLALKFLF